MTVELRAVNGSMILMRRTVVASSSTELIHEEAQFIKDASSLFGRGRFTRDHIFKNGTGREESIFNMALTDYREPERD